MEVFHSPGVVLEVHLLRHVVILPNLANSICGGAEKGYGHLAPAQTRLGRPGKTGGMSWGSLASLESVSPAIPFSTHLGGCLVRSAALGPPLSSSFPHVTPSPTHSTQATSLLSVSRCSPNLRRHQQQRQLPFPMVPPMLGSVYLKLSWPWAI